MHLYYFRTYFGKKKKKIKVQSSYLQLKNCNKIVLIFLKLFYDIGLSNIYLESQAVCEV